MSLATLPPTETEQSATSHPQSNLEIQEREPGADDIALDSSGAASLGHKLLIGATVFGPVVGLVLAIVLMWQNGFMGWLYLGLMLGGMALTGLGITIGYHRLVSHRAFDTYGWNRAFWMFCGALAVEGSPIAWCAVHRKHHQHSDHDGDPHSPHLHEGGWKNVIKGFVHSHFGWLFAQAWSDELIGKYAPDMQSQPLSRMMHRYYGWIVLAALFLPGVIAGLVTQTWTGFWLGVLWGGVIRMFVNHHITWSINSICHIFGSRDFKSNDDSRNNLLMGILAYGEGWHNNHHAFPTSARHGLKWWQFDMSWLVIRTMQACGLVWNVRVPSQRALESKRIR